ncbi:uncharacterized protein LOC135249945 isoform X2 [Anguilla rostrata]|uniref:uncharacterized protein LOC135249945 isoform X2 n=1 Tax=Anguilla rostrata TaxID=7938 RepID=UPI0030CFA7E0
MKRNYYLKSSSYLYSLSFTAQRTNRVSGRGESPEEESSDTVMPPLCAVLVLFSKVYGLLGNIIQPDTLVRAQIGDTVTLPCFYSVNFYDISWYKQPLGQKIQHIAVKVLKENNTRLFNEFENSKRFSAKAAKGSFNLTVSRVEPSDSATYHCAMMPYSETIFGDGTTLMVMGSESHGRTVVLQQPESESVQPGDSVTLQCTVHTETCAGEHSVYWFRQGSGESPPGIISTHGTRSDECQRSSGAVSPTQSCVYNFPKRNLSPSDAGTYYCAVATCGEILFGNGTKLNVAGAASNNQESVEDMASKQTSLLG